MADTSAKPGLTDRQLEDAEFLFLDNLEQERAINVTTSKEIKGQNTLTVKGEKNGIITNYTLDRQGNITVKTELHNGANTSVTIRPDGSKNTPLILANGETLTSSEEGALRNGSIQNAQKMHDYRGFNLGKRNDSRTVEDMGKAIEARADVRLAAIQDGKTIASQSLQQTADRLTANRVADKLDHLAAGNMSAAEAQHLTEKLGNGASVDEFKKGASNYADRLRGAEGPKLVGELRESTKAREGAEFFGELLQRDTSFGKETKVMTEAAEALPIKGGKLVEKIVKHAGAIGGVAVAGMMLAEGASAAEIGEAAIPGASAAVALAEGRPDEAFLRGAEEFVGPLTDLPRVFLRAAGKDVDPPAFLPDIKRMSPADLSDGQNKFDRIYDGVSNIKPEDLPAENRPALEALQENKSLITATEQKLDGKAGQLGADGFDRGKELANLDKYQQQYREVYDDLDQSGQLDGIDSHIAAQKEQKAPAATSDTAIAATQEKTSPVAANDEEYDHPPSQAAAPQPPAPRAAAPAPA